MSASSSSVTLLRIAGVISAGLSAVAVAQAYEIRPELWDRPRTAVAVLEQESLKRAVGVALTQPAARILIHHAAAQESLLQAEELRSWLGALAVDTRRIELRSDAAAGAPIKIEVIP